MTPEELAELQKTINANRPQITQIMNFNAPIGQQIAHVDKIEAHFDKDMGIQISNADEVNCTSPQQINNNIVDLCHLIHPKVIDEDEQIKIHKEVKNLVKDKPVRDICSYLKKMSKEEKILLPIEPKRAMAELQRMGMPNEETEGFTYNNFNKYYMK